MRKLQLTAPRPVSLERHAMGTRADAAAWPDADRAGVRIVAGGLLAVAALVVTGAFIGAPYRSANALRLALEAGDPERIVDVVDFPALRDDLKRQVQSLLQQSVGTDAQSDTAAPLQMMGGAVFNAAIDAAVQPEMVAKLKDLPLDENTAARLRVALKHATVAYDGPNRFLIKVVVADLSSQPIHIVMTRSSPFSWKVSGLVVPSDLPETFRPAGSSGVQHQG